LRQQVDAIREHFVMRASERGCMGAVVIDGVCCTSELPLVDWCDECLMGRMASLLESPAVLDHERSLVAEIQRLKDLVDQLGRLHRFEFNRAQTAEAEIQRLTDALKNKQLQTCVHRVAWCPECDNEWCNQCGDWFGQGNDVRHKVSGLTDALDARTPEK